MTFMPILLDLEHNFIILNDHDGVELSYGWFYDIYWSHLQFTRCQGLDEEVNTQIWRWSCGKTPWLPNSWFYGGVFMNGKAVKGNCQFNKTQVKQNVLPYSIFRRNELQRMTGSTFSISALFLHPWHCLWHKGHLGTLKNQSCYIPHTMNQNFWG